MRRWVSTFSLCLVLVMTLSGCVRVDRSVTLNSDGSGSFTLALAFARQVLSLSGNGFSTQLDAYGAATKARGGTYTRQEGSTYIVWSYGRVFTSVAELNTQLQEVPTFGVGANTTTPTGGGSVAAALPLAATTDLLHVSEQTTPLRTVFHITGRIALPTQPDVDTNHLGPTLSSLLKDAQENFVISLPGMVTTHNGGTAEGDTVRYTVHYGQSADIDVSAGGPNTVVLYRFAGATLGTMAMLTVGVFMFLRRRRRLVAVLSDKRVAVGAAPSYAPRPQDSMNHY